MKKIVIIALVLVLTTCLLTACSFGGNMAPATTNQTVPSTTRTTTSTPLPTTLPGTSSHRDYGTTGTDRNPTTNQGSSPTNGTNGSRGSRHGGTMLPGSF